jgi:hypothetical protein
MSVQVIETERMNDLLTTLKCHQVITGRDGLSGFHSKTYLYAQARGWKIEDALEAMIDAKAVENRIAASLRYNEEMNVRHYTHTEGDEMCIEDTLELMNLIDYNCDVYKNKELDEVWQEVKNRIKDVLLRN